LGDKNQALAQPTNGQLSNVREVYGIFFTIGLKPTSRVLLVFDTGSDFTWVQPKDCSWCMRWKNTYASSSTLALLSCRDDLDESRFCSTDYVPHAECKEEKCWYKIHYDDNGTSAGLVAHETVGLNLDTAPAFRILFGLGYYNWCVDNSSTCFEGIAGFDGIGYATIPSQFGVDTWAFCLPIQPNDRGFISLNDSRKINGEYRAAPLDIQTDNTYRLHMTNVVLHGENILWSGDETKVLADTGTTVSFLQSQLFDRLVESVKFFIAINYDVEPIESPDPNEWQLCYSSKLPIDLSIQVGNITFDFSQPEYTWYEVSSKEPTFCFAFQRSDQDDINILGSHQLRGYLLRYDMSLQEPEFQASVYRLNRDQCAHH